MTGSEYEVVVNGTIGTAIAASLDDLDVRPQRGSTVIRGWVVDQSALHGLLRRLDALGLDVISVRQVPGDT